MAGLSPKSESYAKRRQLFKNIWETAIDNDENDDPAISKPKVIRTMNVTDDEPKKAEKQRIKNLTTVCNKILVLCNKQEADDDTTPEGEGALRKIKTKTRVKKKKRRSKTLYYPYRRSAPKKKIKSNDDVYDNVNAVDWRTAFFPRKQGPAKVVPLKTYAYTGYKKNEIIRRNIMQVKPRIKTPYPEKRVIPICNIVLKM